MDFGTENIMEVRKMNDYYRYDFYNHYDEKTKTRQYFMRVNHKKIEVSKAVYNIYFNSYKKQLRDNCRDEAAGLISMDMEQEAGMTLLDRIGTYTDPIETMDKEEQIAKALRIMDIDKNLITELLVYEKKGRAGSTVPYKSADDQ